MRPPADVSRNVSAAVCHSETFQSTILSLTFSRRLCFISRPNLSASERDCHPMRSGPSYRPCEGGRGILAKSTTLRPAVAAAQSAARRTACLRPATLRSLVAAYPMPPLSITVTIAPASCARIGGSGTSCRTLTTSSVVLMYRRLQKSAAGNTCLKRLSRVSIMVTSSLTARINLGPIYQKPKVIKSSLLREALDCKDKLVREVMTRAAGVSVHPSRWARPALAAARRMRPCNSS